MNNVPPILYLVCETPEIFKISVNGTWLNRIPDGYYRDKSFKMIDISDLIHKGSNIISFDCDFIQSEEFYKNMRNARIFESEKNKLAYDIEIEPIYLIGNFGVKTDGKWQSLDKNAVCYTGGFEIDRLPESISLKNIEQQGFPFFCGELMLEGEIDINGENPVLALDIKGISAVKAEIDGQHKTLLTDNTISLSKCGRGKRKIKLTLINNLRNLLGPHHLEEGETYFAGPDSFYKESCVWNEGREIGWTDAYCFAEFSCI